MVTAYLVRHAEAQGNIEEFFQGHINTDVSEKGAKQLEMLAERFRDISFDAIYSSPLLRAKKTAEAVNKYHGLPITEDERLIEINGGVWEGVKWTEIGERFPESYDKWRNKMWEFQAENGESMAEVYERMKNAVTDIASKNEGKTIVIVSHGCALRNFLSYAEFNDITKLADVGWSDNTAVSEIKFDSDLKPTIVYKNDSGHLPPELSTLAFSRWCKK